MRIRIGHICLTSRWSNIFATWRGILRDLPILVAGSAFLALCHPQALAAQDFWERTHLVDMHSGSEFEGSIRRLGTGGYELSDGTPVDFRDWYHSNWTDLHAMWITQVTDNFGFYWGLSTGERAEKYEIDPSLKFGFITLFPINDASVISLSATTVFGGMLREKPCTADYGQIGGVQRVNCRLAASTLPPAETLGFMMKAKPADRLSISLRYMFRF